jgi:3-keto-disaccharide hydrolase
MKFLHLVTCLGAIVLAPTVRAAGDGWIFLFDGKSLDGWKASETPGTFTVAHGELIAHGKRSHLFYVGPVANHDFKNFELSLEIMARHGSNSGVYFHTEFQQDGWPARGYEVQVNNTHSDWRRGGGLYAIQDTRDAPAQDDEWYTMTIRVEGRHVVTKVNDRMITDYTEPENPERPENMKGRLISHGTFALQGHDPDSEVHFKNIKVRLLP